MGILNWLFSSKNDDEEDYSVSVGGEFSEEDALDSEMSEYERGQAYARAQIDERRQNWQEHGYSSFLESVHIGGEIWHAIVQQEQALIDQGYTERHGRWEFARGARSMYD
jgi:hypothetical protein